MAIRKYLRMLLGPVPRSIHVPLVATDFRIKRVAMVQTTPLP